MTNTEILNAVKTGIKELSDYNDDEIMLWVTVAIGYLKGAGVTDSQIESGEAIGHITLLVDKLRKRETNFGQILEFMIVQLALSGE